MAGGGDRRVGDDGADPLHEMVPARPRRAATTSARRRRRSRSRRSDRHAPACRPAPAARRPAPRPARPSEVSCGAHADEHRRLRNSLPRRRSPSLTPAPLPSIIHLVEAFTGHSPGSPARRTRLRCAGPGSPRPCSLPSRSWWGVALRVREARQRRRGPQGRGGPGPVPDADLHRAAREPRRAGERALADAAGRRRRVRAPGHPRAAAAPLGPGRGTSRTPPAIDELRRAQRELTRRLRLAVRGNVRAGRATAGELAAGQPPLSPHRRPARRVRAEAADANAPATPRPRS